MNAPLGLAFDTTFDDTSVAIIEGKNNILCQLTRSQYAEHQEFGGVLPERASRRHLEVFPNLMQECLKQAQISYQQLDWLAASYTPGLTGAIMVGLNAAKSLAFSLKKPFIGVNHIEAHPYANLLEHGELPFPCLHLVAAGGHTLLLHQKDHFKLRILGGTLDDSCGECVDKAAKMFGYPMPGGAFVDQLAQTHEPYDVTFPWPLKNQTGFNFSFSGLKTSLRYFQEKSPKDLPAGPVLAAFFLRVVEVLKETTLRAAKAHKLSSVTLSGGLSASLVLRKEFAQTFEQHNLRLLVPKPALCTDNAAMVACLAAHQYAAKKFSPLKLSPQSFLALQAG